MEILFWVSAGAIFYVYFGYPVLLAILALFKKRRVAAEPIEPKVTLLITAYNEEANIAEKLEDTLRLDYPREQLEIIVASDESSDRTDEIVKSFAERGVTLLRVEGRVGKTEVQNRAVKIARGDIVIFSDATTKYEKSAIRKMVRNYADPQVGAVSGRYRYVDSTKTPIGTGSIAFWDYENFIKSRQSRIKTITGCCGCIYSVRRSLYVPLPRDIISDLVEPLKIVEKGYRIVFEPEALAYETACEKSKQEMKMRVRVISRGMRGLLYVKGLLNPLKHGLISLQLISHKVLRWFVPVFAALLYVASAFLIRRHTLYLVTFLLQTGFYLSALAGWGAERQRKRIRILSLPLFFCVLNLASLVALVRTLLGRKDVTWKTDRC